MSVAAGGIGRPGFTRVRRPGWGCPWTKGMAASETMASRRVSSPVVSRSSATNPSATSCARVSADRRRHHHNTAVRPSLRDSVRARSAVPPRWCGGHRAAAPNPRAGAEPRRAGCRAARPARSAPTGGRVEAASGSHRRRQCPAPRCLSRPRGRRRRAPIEGVVLGEAELQRDKARGPDELHGPAPLHVHRPGMGTVARHRQTPQHGQRHGALDDIRREQGEEQAVGGSLTAHELAQARRRAACRRREDARRSEWTRPAGARATARPCSDGSSAPMSPAADTSAGWRP